MTVTLSVAHGPQGAADRSTVAPRIQATGDDYDAALEQARAEIPEGHILYSISIVG